jgi:hypothetical protein
VIEDDGPAIEQRQQADVAPLRAEVRFEPGQAIVKPNAAEVRPRETGRFCMVIPTVTADFYWFCWPGGSHRSIREPGFKSLSLYVGN